MELKKCVKNKNADTSSLIKINPINSYMKEFQADQEKQNDKIVYLITYSMMTAMKQAD